MVHIDLNCKYLVATHCITYNHSLYIRDTLCGFSIQEVLFPVVYVIIDDASTDGAQDILVSWAEENLVNENLWEYLPYGRLAKSSLKNNPKLQFIILLLNENHTQSGKVGKKREYVSQWLDNAKYLAFCEGDDYWIDPYKLQKQVDFMEAHPTCAMTYTKAYEQVGNQRNRILGKQYEGFNSLILDNYIPTMTVCIRVQDHKKARTNFFSTNWKMGDYPTWLYLSLEKDLFMIDDITAVYRIVKESATHSSNIEKVKQFAYSTKVLRSYFVEKYAENNKSLLSKIDTIYFYNLLSLYIKRKNIYSMLSFIKQNIKSIDMVYFYKLILK